MRTLVLRMLTSIDGFIADPGGDLRFGSHWSEDIAVVLRRDRRRRRRARLRPCRLREYVPYWEAVAETGKHYGGKAATGVEVEYATRVRDLPKYVASNTLDGITGNTTVVRGADLVEQVAALKSQPGDDLLLMCGPALLSALSAEWLVDEYMLDVYPVALGRGVHLFRDLPEPIALSLVSSRRFPQGVSVHFYKPD